MYAALLGSNLGQVIHTRAQLHVYGPTAPVAAEAAALAKRRGEVQKKIFC